LKRSDHSDWLTKAQVADAIGVSTKTVEKLAADKQLQQASVKRAGKPPIVVYHPGDVERVRKDRNPEGEAFAVPTSDRSGIPDHPTAESGTNAETALTKRAGEPAAFGVMAALIKELGNGSAQVRLTERMYLTVKETSELTGLTQTYVMRKIKAGVLPAIRDVGWKVRRSDLEKL
jgi:excisionase family DNA binding protein